MNLILPSGNSGVEEEETELPEQLQVEKLVQA